MARCDSEPLPIEPKLYLPGSRLSSATSSGDRIDAQAGVDHQRARLRDQYA